MSTGDFLQGGSPKAETWPHTALSPQPGSDVFGEGLALGQTIRPVSLRDFPEVLSWGHSSRCSQKPSRWHTRRASDPV